MTLKPEDAAQPPEDEPARVSQPAGHLSSDLVDNDAMNPDPASPRVKIRELTEEDRRRAIHIQKTARELFEVTRPLHALPEESCDLLQIAVLHCGAPRLAAAKKPHLAALEYVQFYVGDVDDLESQKVLAAVIATQQGKFKRKNFTDLALDPQQQREALTLAALLRISAALDESRSGETFIRNSELAQDGVWVIVDGPAAAVDAAAARQDAGVWAQIGYLPIEVLDPQEAALWLMPYPEPAEKTGILRGEPLSEAGRKVMRYHFAQMLRHEAGTRLGEDIEALHDMRVATRRMRAAFEVFGQAFEKRALKPHLNGLRATGRALGAVRDLDVFMEKAQKYIESLPDERHDGLEPLLKHWSEQRLAARANMLEYLDSAEYARFKRNFNVFVNTPLAGAKTAPADEPAANQVCQLAPILIYQRMAAVRAYGPLLPDAPIERLHALRIEFKKLRYTVEYFREVLGKRAFEVIESIKQLQDHLGDLNDAQVATQILRDFIDTSEKQQESLPIQERENIEEVVNYMAARHAERHRLLATFSSTWETHFDNRAFRRYLAQSISVL
ncbi:MAG: hypothetical protein B6D39_01760 [Anaerolineae bacterium UTCFX2]|jgi:CHAD domain-containing protein|nr:CHAD domain-containing protein [Anaerolineae bacterium]MCZ7552688.1 CHAD domain-containing protein [Anaerolineales bacterium]OQY94231.1 MAG: hypothetical protein B6D39_01760 [Anaerolineae bacterium UTCFX2]